MATRRQGREWAVQLLFQLDLNPGELEKAFAGFWQDLTAEPEAREFAEELVRGVMEHKKELDASIVKCAKNWTVKRMGVVDRNVIRMALYEMHHKDDIPSVVSINEAVDIVKYFSSTESGKFVNGILDRARKDLEQNG